MSAVVTTALTVAARPHSFGWPKVADIAPALSFTRYQLGGTLLWYWYSNADQVVAGRLLGVRDLGVYTMAAATASSISDKIMALLTRTTPAYFAALQDQPAALKRYLLRLTEILSVVLFPVLIGFALVADGFVRLALGPKWLGAIGPLACSRSRPRSTPRLRCSRECSRSGDRTATCCRSRLCSRSCCRSPSSSAAIGALPESPPSGSRSFR